MLLPFTIIARMRRVCGLSRSILLLTGASLSLSKVPDRGFQNKTYLVYNDSKSNDSSSEDCVNPACHSTMDMLKKFNLRPKKNLNTLKKKEDEKNPYCTGCPVDRDKLGRGTWDLIHTIAATYPEEPTEEEQKHADTFLRSLSHVYPCPHCAKHFRQTIDVSPPKVQSREALMMWCCWFHNEVNEVVHKPKFICSVEELDLRWKDGRDECWDIHDDQSSESSA